MGRKCRREIQLLRNLEAANLRRHELAAKAKFKQLKKQTAAELRSVRAKDAEGQVLVQIR